MTELFQKVQPIQQDGGAGIRHSAIEGRYRLITTHQLCLAWWLHQAGHITRRQLRIYFAAHEMHERRRYTDDEKGKGGRRVPTYGIGEIKRLVGGRDSTDADAELAADVRRLARLGLVQITPTAIAFAASIDQIAVEDVAGFWQMLEQMPHAGRAVPVPRRTLRALAAGFSRAVTGVMIALMIRSLFWRKQGDEYRIDGRTKGSWIADVFGISRRAVTDARAHLMKLGWLTSIDAQQWQLNRWGAHDQINVDWTHTISVGDRARQGGEIASPPADYRTEIASPCLNSSPSPSEKNLKTRRLGTTPGLTGVYAIADSRNAKKPAEKIPEPHLRNIHPEHLADTTALLTLHRQAVTLKLAKDSEAGRLDFVSLAERARAHARNAGGMFWWLLTHQRFDFITQADEDAAVQRLKTWRYGSSIRSYDLNETPKPKVRTQTDDEKLVQACLLVAERKGIDPFYAARTVRQHWTRAHWEAALTGYEAADIEQAGDRKRIARRDGEN